MDRMPVIVILSGLLQPAAEVGAKVAVNDALLPALMFIGIVAPLMPNPAPEAVAWVTVRVALPEFVKVIV